MSGPPGPAGQQGVQGPTGEPGDKVPIQTLLNNITLMNILFILLNYHFLKTFLGLKRRYRNTWHAGKFGYIASKPCPFP